MLGPSALERQCGLQATLTESGRKLMLLPQEILEAGAAKVSAQIHTLAATDEFWAHYLHGAKELPPWPEESGGRATMELMRLRCEELRKDPSLRVVTPPAEDHIQFEMHRSFIDHTFYKLVEPERQRLMAGMAAAIQRLRALVKDSG